MKKHLLLAAAAILTLAACNKPVNMPSDSLTLTSPGSSLTAHFAVIGGVPYYDLYHGDEAVVLPSRLGFELLQNQRFVADGDLKEGFSLVSSATDSKDEEWETVWGEESKIRNHYNELLVSLKKDNGAIMNVRFRLYDDGLGFRYEFPQENYLRYFNIKEELTEFAMAGNHTAWWISGDYDSQEYNYTKSRLSEIEKLNYGTRIYQASQEEVAPTSVQTALQMKTDSGLYINIHEAAVLNYPTTNLDLNPRTLTFRTWLTPDAQDVKGRMQTPCKTPWRTVMVTTSATKTLASRLILNLNDPCAYDDVSWIHPVKYMGVWWEMIVGKSSWAYTYDVPSVQLGVTDYRALKPNGVHGANNENVRRYIDFAAENGFDAVLVEGWNEGWEDWFGCKKDFVFDFITPYPDFDLPALNEYAHSKGIRIVMHHETSSSTVNYERWIDEAYDLMDKYGYNAVKSGYVGDLIPYGERHYSQYMINHYQFCLEEAAKHHIMVNGHEAVRPTGLCRTYPNLIGNEAAMGTEYRADINPGHTCVLPFTRLQGGPMDYTPGILEVDLSVLNPNDHRPMRHTICNQLGLYVTFYSPLQMAADTPENYAKYMDAFQFIKDVAVDWEKTLYLEAEPMEYIVTARKPRISSLNASGEGVAKLPDGKKDMLSGAARYVYALGPDATAKDLERATPRDVWYVGGICGEKAREVKVDLGFLNPVLKYEATIYADAPDADYETNPKAYTITKQNVDCATVLDMKMARSGGFAISIREIR